MSNLNKSIWGFVLIVAMIACEEAFESTVDFKVPEQPSVLATTAVFPLNFISSQIFLTNTVKILDPSPAPIKAAIIELSIGDQLIDDWKYDTLLQRHINRPLDKNTVYGKTASLKIEVPGFPISTASIIVPDTAKVIDIEYGYQKTFDTDGNRADLLNIKIDDPAGEENFYGVTAYTIRNRLVDNDIFMDTVTLYLQSDELITEGYNPVFFSDATFDGKEAGIRITSFNFNFSGNTDAKVLVRVYSFPKAYYLYLKSTIIYENADGNPFAEPSDIYSNMSGGVGIFSINPVNEYEVEVDP